MRVEAAIGAVAASGSETELEFRVIDANGVARWFNARGRVLRDAVGQPVRLVGTMQEMPATVVAERRMRRQLGERWGWLDQERLGTWWRLWGMLKEELAPLITGALFWKQEAWEACLKVLAERPRRRT